MHIDTLRQHLLEDPSDWKGWSQLARLALASGGDQEVVEICQQFGSYAAMEPMPGDGAGQAESPGSIEPPQAGSAEEASVGLASLSEDPTLNKQPMLASGELKTLEDVAQAASLLLEQRNLKFLILSVSAGTITIASSYSVPKGAGLYVDSEQTHVQVSEKLIYRDPSTGVRVSCLTMEPIRLSTLVLRQLQEYEFRYDDQLVPLVEAMPSLRTPLHLQLEGWDGMLLRGWMVFSGTDLLPRSPSLVVKLNDEPLQVLSPTLLRLDVMEALQNPHNVMAGFKLYGFNKLVRRESSIIQFCDPITLEVYTSSILHRSRTFHEQILQVSKGFCGFGFQNRDGEVVVTSTPRHVERQPLVVHPCHKIDILVPVYKNWSLTRQCLKALHASLLLAQSDNLDAPVEIYIHVTNDCSPDQDVNNCLADLCETLGFILHVNSENLGFIHTVNNFMKATTGDVLLLNSDVIVSLGCIRELLRARSSVGPHVGTLTAFSNNATIFSFPLQVAENPVSSVEAIDHIAQAFRDASDHVGTLTHQVPVSHGFLMYITRTALDSIGYFDDYFGMGYGEEVDWAVRAALKGFEHHLCTSAYAFHKGSASFGTSTRLKAVENSSQIIASRYPFYDTMIQEFIAYDELIPLRNSVSRLLLERSEKPYVIHVTHSSGGGIDKYINSMIDEIEDCHHALLRPGRTYADLAKGDAAAKTDSFTLECAQRDAVVIGDLATSMLGALVGIQTKISRFIIHSFVGWKSEEIEQLILLLNTHNIGYDVVAHDYMFLCPMIKLIDASGTFCDVGSTNHCNHCLRTSESLVETSLLAPYTSDIELYRAFFATILNGADQIICSTQDQASRISKLWFSNTVILEPNEPSYCLLPGIKHDNNSRNIVLVGGISVEKGADRLFQVASLSLQINSLVHFYLIGAVSNSERMQSLPNFTHIGAYASFNELYDYLSGLYSPTAFFPTIWPETWCYTLSEVLMLGLPTLAPKLGAIGSRLEAQNSPLIKLYSPELSDYQLAELVCAGFQAE